MDRYPVRVKWGGVHRDGSVLQLGRRKSDGARMAEVSVWRARQGDPTRGRVPLAYIRKADQEGVEQWWQSRLQEIRARRASSAATAPSGAAAASSPARAAT